MYSHSEFPLRTARNPEEMSFYNKKNPSRHYLHLIRILPDSLDEEVTPMGGKLRVDQKYAEVYVLPVL